MFIKPISLGMISLFLFFTLGCNSPEVWPQVNTETEYKDYGAEGLKSYKEGYPNHIDYYNYLLKQFPDDNLGMGPEPGSPEIGMTHQPMTYGLLLSAEVLHYKSQPSELSKQKIRQAARWLIDNKDLNSDGQPGWGLPQAWDAFADGTINPENHPYTITTAIVISALLDALDLEDLWSRSERTEIETLVKDVSIYWCEKVWSEDNQEGFFWYSISPTDNYFCPNVSAMFLGSLARVISEQKNFLSNNELALLKDRVNKAADGIMANTKWADNVPYWDYIVYADNNIENVRPNDLVHHVYILWGMELYRSSGIGETSLPWSLEQALESLNYYWSDDKTLAFPTNVHFKNKDKLKDRPARLWGMGMMLAFYGKFGAVQKADYCTDIISRDYGPFPNLKLWPQSFSQDIEFYPRYAAHVLYGLAYADFYNK